MKAMKSALIAASVSVLVGALGMSAASAAPITFTWNPAGASTPLGGSSFTASNLFIADYATINASDPGHVTETALLDVVATNGSAPGLVGNASGGAGNYQLYFMLTAGSYINPVTEAGQITSLSYQLIGVVGGGCSFSVGAGLSGPTATGCGTTEVLASGVLGNGPNSVGFQAGTSQPYATASATISTAAGESNFFVSPTAAALSLGDLFNTSFTNSSDVYSACDSTGNNCVDGGAYSAATPVIKINGGGGNLTLAVPEPLTLSLFGAGLVGAGVLRRRQKSKKA